MGEQTFEDSFDPYQEMRAFYRLDDPTEEQQFRFVESMKYLIDTAIFESDVIAFSYNLAKYYLDIKKFELAKKYFELGAQFDEACSKEALGLIWYYGLTGEQDYEKAFQYFSKCETKRSRFMIADMYHVGSYVRRSKEKCREIIEELFEGVKDEREDARLSISTLFPEIALRLVKLNLEDGRDSMSDLNRLFDARDILTIRQQHRPFWGNLKIMRDILETTVVMVGNDFDFIDLYDLMTYDTERATVTFDYAGTSYRLEIFRNEGEIVYQFGEKWFHGAEDFLEKARIDSKRITTVMNQIINISVN